MENTTGPIVVKTIGHPSDTQGCCFQELEDDCMVSDCATHRNRNMSIIENTNCGPEGISKQITVEGEKD